MNQTVNIFIILIYTVYMLQSTTNGQNKVYFLKQIKMG